jgi:hypothetical protein
VVIKGAVFPACPGTMACRFDAEWHHFHNMSVSDVIADLSVRLGRAVALDR